MHQNEQLNEERLLEFIYLYIYELYVYKQSKICL